MLTVLAVILIPMIELEADPPSGSRPIVIAHRGASGYRPEHTLAAYQLAIDLGADFIEPDLVITKDGVLVARHENEISSTTDVARHPEFAARKTTKSIDGQRLTGWFTEDFTLAELKQLRAIERIPELRPENRRFDGQFEIPTLREVIRLAKTQSTATGRTIGIAPETKHPSYFQSLGRPLEPPLVSDLQENGYTGRDAPVLIQSFEVANLKKLRSLTQVPLVQLIAATGSPPDFTAKADVRTYADLISPAGLAEIHTYAAAIAPDKSLVIPRDRQNRLLPPTGLVELAHAVGLKVYPWTCRAENRFLPAELQVGSPADGEFERRHGDAREECRRFWILGIDGLFSDHPDTAIAAWRGIPSQP